jgi:hypothetical protein
MTYFLDNGYRNAEHVSGMAARIWPAMPLVDGLDRHAAPPELEDVVAPARPRMADWCAAALTGADH